MNASMPAPREPDAEDAATDIDPATPGAARPVQALPPIVDAPAAGEPEEPGAAQGKTPARKTPARKPATKKSTASTTDAGEAPGTAAPSAPRKPAAPRTSTTPRKPAAPRAATSARTAASTAETAQAAETVQVAETAQPDAATPAAKTNAAAGGATKSAAASAKSGTRTAASAKSGTKTAASAKSAGSKSAGTKSGATSAGTKSGATSGAASAAAKSSGKTAAGKTTAKSGAKTTSGRTKKPATPPPPPIPADLVEADGETIIVPPKPPLPADETSAAATTPAPETEAEAAPRVESAQVEPAPVEVREAEAAPVETADSAPVVEPEAASVETAEPEPAAPIEPSAQSASPEADVTVADVEVAEPVAATDREPAAAVAEPASDREDLDGGADAAASAPALSLRGVTKIFGDARAVDGIDLTVPAGTFYGLVGPNGAGKTTTLSMIAGLLQADRGTISVNGIDAAKDPQAAKRAMGVLPDRLRTFDRLTGRQLLYYYGVLRGLSPAVVESRTADLARAFDLTDALGRVVSDYSAGMTKKVMLAGAMIHSPRLLVLDEPFEAVDPVSSAIILDILSAYVERGGTVVLSSHGMELVERVCTRVAVLVAGQVLAEGTIDEVRGELTLEQRFIELAGGLGDVEGLEWLHTFSD